MGLILTLILGGIVGWLASILMKTDARRGLVANVFAGVIGSYLGGVIADALELGSAEPLAGVFVSMGGAAALIAILLVLGVFDRLAPAR